MSPASVKPPAGEKDLALKVAMRRVFWGMNYATRINLKLALPGDRRSSDELSDLDCVAFSTGADFSVRLLIADCKSGSRVSPAARAFWLAGVREFFVADRAYLVLEREIPKGAREQAGRLGLDVVGQLDRQILENVHGPHAPTAPFLEVAGVTELQSLSKGLDKRLDGLVSFREHDYWSLPEERRLQRLLVELRRVGPILDPSQKAHRVLFVDLLFLFGLALLRACRYVSSVSLASPREAVLEYLLGGAEQTRSRRKQLELLQAALKEVDQSQDEPNLASAIELEPAYFDDLSETITRLLRRPRDAQRLLRYIEWWGQAQVGLGGPSVVDGLGPTYGDYTRKLVADIGRTCVSAAQLGPPWMAIATAAGNGGSCDERDADESSASERDASQMRLA